MNRREGKGLSLADPVKSIRSALELMRAANAVSIFRRTKSPKGTAAKLSRLLAASLLAADLTRLSF